MPWGRSALEPSSGGLLVAYSSEYGLSGATTNSGKGYLMDEQHPKSLGTLGNCPPYLPSEAYIPDEQCSEAPLAMDAYVSPYVPYQTTPFHQQTQLLQFEPRQLSGDDSAFSVAVSTYLANASDQNAANSLMEESYADQKECLRSYYSESIPGQVVNLTSVGQQKLHPTYQAGLENGRSFLDVEGGTLPKLLDTTDVKLSTTAAVLLEGEDMAGDENESLTCVNVKQPDLFGLKTTVIESDEDASETKFSDYQQAENLIQISTGNNNLLHYTPTEGQ